MSIDMKKVLKDHIKLWSALAFAIVFAGLMLFLFSGDNLPILKALFTETDQKEDVRDSLSQLGWRGYITVGILAMLQVVLTFLPAEPVQVVSGIAFGFLGGFLACLAGVIIGNTAIFLLYRIYGQKLTEYFSKSVEFDFDIARRSKKVAWIIFILYFLPAIPYGMICLFAASLGIRYPRYIILTVLGSIPSIVIGVELGDLAIEASLFLSIGVFVVLLALLAVLVHYRSAIFKKLNAYMDNSNDSIVFAEVPLLFECGYEHLFEKILVVQRRKEDRVNAVAARDALSKEDILARMDAQFPYDTEEGENHIKKIHAYQIFNNDTTDYLKTQINEFLNTNI